MPMSSNDSDDTVKSGARTGGNQMKLRYIASVVLAAASAGAIVMAPLAAADSNVQQHPGNVQLTATPGAAAQEAAQIQQPFGGNGTALLFHH
jgi:hypothetical protein